MKTDCDYFEIARKKLLVPTGLDNNDVAKIMTKLGQTPGHDFSDAYFQYAKQESWALDEGRVKSGSFTIEQGVGLRAVCAEKTAFAYSEDLSLPAILAAAEVVKSLGVLQKKAESPKWNVLSATPLYEAQDPLQSISDAEKIALLQCLDKTSRQQDSRVKEVMCSLSGVYEIILIVRSDGKQIADVRPLVRLNVTVIVEDKGRRESASYGGGGRYGYSEFTSEVVKKYATEAVRQAVLNLDAKDAPAGTMPVVLGPGWPGVLLHEAVGHGLEGDFNRKGVSAFSDRIGEKVASEHCTVVDNGTLHRRRGSLSIDDEGNQTQETVLIEKGILRNYLQDEMNARLMGMPVTGNGRRESYAHLPMPRMTNTYMLSGDYEPDEIIASVKDGLYAVNFSGGQVDITSGKFVFSSNEAYKIENGKITYPVKGATLIGNGPQAMHDISMVGNDMALDNGVGVCGKDGQSVPVGVGQPTLKMDAMTVGGVNL